MPSHPSERQLSLLSARTLRRTRTLRRETADADGFIGGAELSWSLGAPTRGKTALREYWSTGLCRIPNLHCDLLGVYVGIDTVVINYRTQIGGLVNEVLRFDEGLVVEGHGTLPR